MRTRMHLEEVLTDEPLARSLLRAQHPQWAELPLRLVDSFGTDHDVWRLGDALSLRLPRTGWAARQAAKEDAWLPMLAALPVAVPSVVALGDPSTSYPYPWSVQTWLPGTDLVTMTADGVPDVVVDDLAGVVRALRTVPTEGAPARPVEARGGALDRHDVVVGERIGEVSEDVDPDALRRAWEQSRAAAPPSRDGWTHGDLMPGNLLATDGRLTGVIDWGALNVTDVALDLTPCWYLLGGVDSSASRRYLAALDATEDEVLRARGWAQLQALNALPYYRDTNPGMTRLAGTALTLITTEAG